MVFVLIKASLLGGKYSSSFDNRQHGGMGKTSTEVNLLSRILLRISLAESKAKFKKMSPTDTVKAEEKIEAKIEAEPRFEKEEENLGKASPKDISDTHLLPYDVAILDDFLIRWMTQVFQPSLI
jgi:hypothetical protein